MHRNSLSLALCLTAMALGVSTAFAEDLEGNSGLILLNSQRSSRAGSLPLSTAAGTDADTIWVGYWAGANLANNPWKVGGIAGGNRLPNVTNGAWTFEPNQHVNGDSLSGWHSTRSTHVDFSGAVLPDTDRPWWAVEYGNIANHASSPGGGNSKTYGVVGVWHRDGGSAAAQVFQPGLTGSQPSNPSWAPLGGSYSAWMGLRAHGDVTYLDPITGNPFSASALQLHGFNPSSKAVPLFPGYIGNMDQMLYRNIDLSSYAGGGLSVRFTYRTDMSTMKDTDPRYRTGWFEGDWLSLDQPSAGNFISAEADAGGGPGSGAPIDSLQLYIGTPVEGEWKSSLNPFDADPQLISLGIINPMTGRRILQDPLRRWMNEVLLRDARVHLFGVAGTNPEQTTTVFLPHLTVQTLLDSSATVGQAGRLRLCFRVHTNRRFDDAVGSLESGYNSGKAGAAVIDDVQIDIGGGFQTIGDFEAAGSIDNGPANASADLAWRSTGKPPETYFHPHDIATLPYADVLGPVGSANRLCNLDGVVISSGLHDQNEAASNPSPVSTEHEGRWGMISPVINLAGADPDSKDPSKNNMNLSSSERAAEIDYVNYFEIYTGNFDVFTQGQMWQAGFQSYPVQQSDGVEMWGPIVMSPSLYFNPGRQCLAVAEPASNGGLIRTSNIGPPDSLRIALRKISECYRFGITTACSPTDGGYFDNCALAIVDYPQGSTPLATSGGVPFSIPWRETISINSRDYLHDTFPANENPGLPGTPAFDTTAALIKSGLNIAQTTGNVSRYLIPGDSLVVQAIGDSIRLDLLFRVQPGVGNYMTAGNRNSGLRDFGTGFFASYQINPGTYSGMPGSINTGAALAAHSAAPSGWSPLVWNSARMDTSEAGGLGTFPVQGAGIKPTPSGRLWCGTYHETELAARPSLGIVRNICFVIDTLVANLNDPNVHCGSPAKGAYPPAWVTTLPASRTGWNGVTTTMEDTKIIPDGLLTPGAHVQYFVRRQEFGVPTATFTMVPDTGRVLQENRVGGIGISGALNSGDWDGHRWQHFSVLPDRWKDPAFGGLGMACMLLYDNADRRGNERVWKDIAYVIGATTWDDNGNDDGRLSSLVLPVDDPQLHTPRKNKSAGTLWDMYGKKASEEPTLGANGIGGRLGFRGPATLVDEKWTRNPPTLDMLNTYYKTTLVLSADISRGLWGPFPDQSSDDVTTFQGWLGAGNTASPDRGIIVIGESFMEAALQQSGAQASFVQDFLGALLVDPDYFTYLPSSQSCVHLQDISGLVASYPPPPVRRIAIEGLYGSTPDVLNSNGPITGAESSWWYVPPIGPNYPVAAVYKSHSAGTPWISHALGVDLAAVRSPYCGNVNGRNILMYYMLLEQFGSVCTLVGAPIVVLDTPQALDAKAFMAIGSNPSRTGSASIILGVPVDDAVEVKLFDVAGRCVRTLVERRFQAGEHTLVWDGRDDHGNSLPRGVYFARVIYTQSNFRGDRKIVMLR